jgi:hypothetical protein
MTALDVRSQSLMSCDSHIFCCCVRTSVVCPCFFGPRSFAPSAGIGHSRRACAVADEVCPFSPSMSHDLHCPDSATGPPCISALLHFLDCWRRCVPIGIDVRRERPCLFSSLLHPFHRVPLICMDSWMADLPGVALHQRHPLRDTRVAATGSLLPAENFFLRLVALSADCSVEAKEFVMR